MVRLFASLAIPLLLCGCGSHPPGSDGGVPPPDLAGGDLPASGNCQPACTAGNPHCNPKGHCVACLVDTDCPSGSYCKVLSDVASACTPGCMSDARCHAAGGQASLSCCGMTCVDTATDTRNCGGCGMACNAVHAGAKCTAGQCTSGTCDPGWGDCDGDPKNGCEANLHVDPQNCTACGAKCAIPNALTGCADGCYATACKFGFADCNGDPMDGCETTVLSDSANCGGCGTLCKGLPNATASCISGACVLGACSPGWVDCNNNSMDGCEANLMNDPKNCSMCGKSCNGKGCLNGQCTTFRPNVMLCGPSGRSPATFYPMGTNFTLLMGCTPDDNTQALFVTRSGNGFNPQTLQAYVMGGGIILTEYNISQNVWNAVFGGMTPMGAREGSCTDVLPSVVQMNPKDPFWLANQFMAIQPGDSGCGYAVDGYPGITTLCGWDAQHAAVGYRTLGQGRVWATDFDWQDNEMQKPYTYTNQLMGYMMLHR